jgi:hypothetical protein
MTFLNMLVSTYRALTIGLATGLTALLAVALADLSVITNAIGQNDTAVQPRYLGGELCAECHQEVYDAWTGSHHDFALKPATADTVFGKFEEVTFEAQGITTRFFRRDSQFFPKQMVRTGRFQSSRSSTRSVGKTFSNT